MTSDPNYASLARVLELAHSQAATGKGHERHVTANEPFEEQLICWIQRQGFDFCSAQAVKKAHEALRLPPEAAIRELLGAINYLAAAVIVLEEKIGKSDNSAAKAECHNAFADAEKLHLAQILITAYSLLPLSGVLTEHANQIKMPGDVAEIQTFGGILYLPVNRSFEVSTLDTLDGIAKNISNKIIEAAGGIPWKAFAMGCRMVGGDKLEVFYGVFPEEKK
jgi:hypothetical protein